MQLQIGNFGGGVQVDGQTIKTKMVHALLLKKFESVITIDIYKFTLLNYLLLLIKLPYLMYKADSVYIGLGKRGMKIISPIIVFFGAILKKKINYYVIGGWIVPYLEENKWLIPIYMKFNAILVELHSMESSCRDLGLNNTFYFPNFRLYEPKPAQINTIGKSFKFVFFSRVIPEKGIFTAIEALDMLLKQNFSVSLDIFGPVHDQEVISKIESVDGCNYKGVLSPEGNSIYNTLNNYDLLIFPTYYEGEGFPGAIVDAFLSGLAVVASDWKFNKEIIEVGKNGMLFKVKCTASLYNILADLCMDKEKVQEMKDYAIETSRQYTLQPALNVIDEIL